MARGAHLRYPLGSSIETIVSGEKVLGPFLVKAGRFLGITHNEVVKPKPPKAVKKSYATRHHVVGEETPLQETPLAQSIQRRAEGQEFRTSRYQPADTSTPELKREAMRRALRYNP